MNKLFYIFAFMLAISPGLALPAHAAEITEGALVTCPDYSAVYYISGDDRYSFPNEKIYFSWYEDFNSVVNIECSELANYSLRGSMTYQPGTRLVKIPSVNTVYFIQAGGLLRPIRDEAQALRLFGSEWASRVDDLSEAFYPHYELGPELGDAMLPFDYLLTDDGGFLHRVMPSSDIVEQGNLLPAYQNRVLLKHARQMGDIEYNEDVISSMDHTLENLDQIAGRANPLAKTYGGVITSPQEWVDSMTFISGFIGVIGNAGLVDGVVKPDILEAYRTLYSEQEIPDADILAFYVDLLAFSDTASEITALLDANKAILDTDELNTALWGLAVGLSESGLINIHISSEDPVSTATDFRNAIRHLQVISAEVTGALSGLEGLL